MTFVFNQLIDILLLTADFCGKHRHDLRGEVWAHKNKTQTLSAEMLVASQ